MLPSLEKTKELFDYITAITDEQNVKAGDARGLSRHHYENVAWVASVIAENTELDTNKAYIIGLFHDYGEYIQKSVPNTFHGTAGYDEMMLLGYDEVARVCLSHSFFDADFKPEDFPAYNSKEIKRASKILKEQGFDDYDRLIHLADLLSPADRIDTIENRIEALRTKYNLSKEDAHQKLKKAQALKQYFDQKAQKDIYELLRL